jgi:2'-5' RNA ligase
VTAGAARLFFAVWPAPGIQSALGEVAGALQRSCGGRAVPERNIHLTLVFLGDVPREHAARLQVLAATVKAAPFDLAIDHAAYWRHNRIVWAGVRECPAALTALVGQLARRLAGEGRPFDRRPYVPHITLLRNARRAPADPFPGRIEWPVTRFALMESVARNRRRAYEVLREWPLDG